VRMSGASFILVCERWTGKVPIRCVILCRCGWGSLYTPARCITIAYHKLTFELFVPPLSDSSVCPRSCKPLVRRQDGTVAQVAEKMSSPARWTRTSLLHQLPGPVKHPPLYRDAAMRGFNQRCNAQSRTLYKRHRNRLPPHTHCGPDEALSADFRITHVMLLCQYLSRAVASSHALLQKKVETSNAGTMQEWRM
jgi:hypothetical protein